MIPKEITDKIVDAMYNNVGIEEIKTKFGVSNYTVYKIKKQNGFNRNGKSIEQGQRKVYVRRGEHSHYVFQNQNRHESFIENCF